ncbi:MAG: ABC transporter permease [Armatimonadota bacterium]|nr:ABC transporter permease [Armatimonadota bacterium]
MPWRYWCDLLVVLASKEIKLRYRSSWLGYLWSVANPLAFASLYFVAFGVFMRVSIPNYPLFLVAGLFPWHWIANSVSASPAVFLQNTTLLKKVRFPYSALVAALVLSDGLHFVGAVPVLLVALSLHGVWPSWSWLGGLPLLAVAQFIFVYGVALGIASLNVFFRDLERLTAIGVVFLFFLTPVVYPEWMVPAQYRALIHANPAALLVLAWRKLLLDGEIDWSVVGGCYGAGCAVLGLGGWIYKRLSVRFAEMV